MIKKKNSFLLFVCINKNILIVIKIAIDKLAVCKKNQVKVKWMKKVKILTDMEEHILLYLKNHHMYVSLIHFNVIIICYFNRNKVIR